MKSVKLWSWLAESRIFDLWSGFFDLLRCISLFTIIRTCCPVTKEVFLFSTDAAGLEENLNEGIISKELKVVFRSNGFKLSENAPVWAEENEKWRITTNKSPYIIKKECGTLKIYRKNYGFVEMWALINLLLAIGLLLIWSALNLYYWLTFAFVIYGVFRVFEVFIYLINVLLFDPERKRKKKKTYAILNPYRLVILTLQNYVEIIFWFALFYRYVDWAFETGGVALDSFFVSLNFSFVTMTTFGYTTITPTETWGEILAILVFLQSVIGLSMILLIVASFISWLPKPSSLN